MILIHLFRKILIVPYSYQSIGPYPYIFDLLFAIHHVTFTLYKFMCKTDSLFLQLRIRVLPSLLRIDLEKLIVKNNVVLETLPVYYQYFVQPGL